MNEVFIPKTSFIAYLLLVYDKCRLVVKNIFFVLFLPVSHSFIPHPIPLSYDNLISEGPDCKWIF